MLMLWRRELTRIARSGGTPWFLLAYLGLGFLLAAGTLTLLQNLPQYLFMVGLQEPVMLTVLAAYQLVFLLLAAGGIGGDLAAHDLESGEHELLVATGRSRFGLLAVKFAAALTWLGLLWMVFLPLYSLLPRLGSFSLQLLAKVAAVQLATVCAVAALGFLVGQLARSRRTATAVATGLVLFALLGSYLLGGLLTYALQGGQGGVFFGGPMIMRGAPGMAQPLPVGLGMQVDGTNPPTFTKRMILLSSLSPAAGMMSALDVQGQPPLMPGLPVYFTAPYLTAATRHPLWEVQAAGYGGLTVLLLLVTYVGAAWPRRRFWRRRYNAMPQGAPAMIPHPSPPAAPAMTGSEAP